MHASLTQRGTLTMIGASALVAAGTAMLPGPFPAVAWGLAAAFGVVVGVLQTRALRAAPRAFLAAESTVEVREALMSSSSGRMAVALQWVLLPILLAVAWRSGSVVAGALGGYAVFMGVRDAVALRALVALASTPGVAEG